MAGVGWEGSEGGSARVHDCRCCDVFDRARPPGRVLFRLSCSSVGVAK
jgi:hypothetical protein